VPTATVELHGHIVDSLLLAKVLDAIVEAGVAYEITELEVGTTNLDPSRARIELTGDHEAVESLLEELEVHGVTRVAGGDHRC
jgi:hypothetical protein